MNKIKIALLFSLFIMFLFSFIGCKKDDDPTKSPIYYQYQEVIDDYSPTVKRNTEELYVLLQEKIDGNNNYELTEEDKKNIDLFTNIFENSSVKETNMLSIIEIVKNYIVNIEIEELFTTNNMTKTLPVVMQVIDLLDGAQIGRIYKNYLLTNFQIVLETLDDEETIALINKEKENIIANDKVFVYEGQLVHQFVSALNKNIIANEEIDLESIFDYYFEKSDSLTDEEVLTICKKLADTFEEVTYTKEIYQELMNEVKNLYINDEGIINNESKTIQILKKYFDVYAEYSVMCSNLLIKLLDSITENEIKIVRITEHENKMFAIINLIDKVYNTDEETKNDLENIVNKISKILEENETELEIDVYETDVTLNDIMTLIHNDIDKFTYQKITDNYEITVEKLQELLTNEIIIEYIHAKFGINDSIEPYQ